MRLGSVKDATWGKAALVISVIALLAALVGGAYGLGRNSVKTKNLANGAVSAPKLGKIAERTAPLTLPADTLPGDGIVSVDSKDVPCRPGEKALSGGASYTGSEVAAEVAVRSSYRNGNSWHIAMTNDSGAQQAGIAYVYCLEK